MGDSILRGNMQKSFPWRDRSWLYQKWYIEKLPAYEIAKEAGCEISVLYTWLCRFGIRDDSTPVRMRLNYTYKNKEWLIDKYLTEDLSTIQIGELVGRTSECIRYWLEKYGIRRDRNHKEDIFMSLPKDEPIETISLEIMQKLKPLENGVFSDDTRRAMSKAATEYWKTHPSRRKRQSENTKLQWTSQRKKAQSDRMKKRWADGVYEGVSFGTYRSNLEILVADTLNSLDVLYKEQYTIPGDVTNRKYDFFLYKYNLMLECHGEYWHSDDSNPGVSIRDREKKDFAVSSGFEYVVVWEDSLRGHDPIVILRNALGRFSYA